MAKQENFNSFKAIASSVVYVLTAILLQKKNSGEKNVQLTWHMHASYSIVVLLHRNYLDLGLNSCHQMPKNVVLVVFTIHDK